MFTSSLLTPQERAFLAQHNLDTATLDALPGDASARRYVRLVGQDLLLMIDPTDPQGFAGYLAVAAHLRGLGLSAPHVQAVDVAQGLALIEDWGDATYTRRLREGANETTLYARAVDALVTLHDHPDGARMARPNMDLTLLQDEISATFCDWFAPALEPQIDLDAFRAALAEHWRRALTDVARVQSALVLRDFHIDNLMELDSRQGVERIGLLDFQDAALGAPEYDLVSLLQDARRDLAPGLEEAMLARYLARLSEADRAEACARYHLLAAQRHCRIAGVFVRLARRDGKPHYLQWLPRVIGQFDRALSAAGLRDLRQLLDHALPDWVERGRGLAVEMHR